MQAAYLTIRDKKPDISVALLTGGGDRPYAFGLATALISNAAAIDLIGSDNLDFPEFHNNPKVHFLNLRGDQGSHAGFLAKAMRVVAYYVRLIGYAAKARPQIFHILWNNKFQVFDRTLLMLYYKMLGKKIVLTAHNVNIGRRDSADSYLNRFTLKIQYLLSDHIFVHTETMKLELIEEFAVPDSRITVIPFGINNSVPNTALKSPEAKKRLGVESHRKVILFFGNIAPYKGLEYLVRAFQKIAARRDEYGLIIAGRPKDCVKYWTAIQQTIADDVLRKRIVVHAVYIPDEHTEIYFKAADLLVLPYTYIYQSGVMFLGHSFGLPVVASDVGSLKEDIVEGKNGFLFRSEDSNDLARVIEQYFDSELFANLEDRRNEIRHNAVAVHSWDIVSHLTMGVYAKLLQLPSAGDLSSRGSATCRFM